MISSFAGTDEVACNTIISVRQDLANDCFYDITRFARGYRVRRWEFRRRCEPRA